MQAITTRYHGPTNTRGSTITATSASGERATVSYDDAWDSDMNHSRAVLKLCERLRWAGRLTGGSTKDGMVWVFTDKGAPIINIDPAIWAVKP